MSKVELFINVAVAVILTVCTLQIGLEPYTGKYVATALLCLAYFCFELGIWQDRNRRSGR